MSLNSGDEIQEKALEAEQEFAAFLDNKNIVYMPLSNERVQFSLALKNVLNAKRPDLLVLFPKVGRIFVDVKYKSDEREFSSYYFNSEDVDKYKNLEDAFKIDVWYAISNRQLKYRHWYWLCLNDMRSGKFEKSRDEKKFIVPKKELIKVSCEGERPLREVAQKIIRSKRR